VKPSGDLRGAVLRRLAAWLLLAGLPFAVSQVAAFTLFGGAVTRAVAYAPNDEIAYWNQIAAFERAGFGGGYTTVEEQPSPATFSHFGPHGPMFPMLYGSAARLVGWRSTSGPLFGLIAIGAGAAVFSALAEVPLIGTAVLVGTFWPLAIALPHTMQEPLHYAFAFLLAGLSVRVLATDTPGTAVLVVTAVTLSLTSLVRPVWALLAIPLGWHVGRLRRTNGAWYGAASGLTFAVVTYFAFMMLAAPYPYSSRLFAGLREAPVRALVGLADHMVREAPREWFSTNAEPLELVVRCELLLTAVGALLLARRAATDIANRRRYAFVATVAVLLVGAVLAVGEIGTWRDYRTITPVLLMLLLIAAATRTRMMWGIVVLHIAAAGAALHEFRDAHEDRFAKARIADVETFAAAIAPHIRFDPSTSAWGNTVLINVERYTFLLLGLPHGIGASAVLSWDRVTLPPRSRYLLLGPDERTRLGARVRLRRLTSTPLGELYENDDWQR